MPYRDSPSARGGGSGRRQEALCRKALQHQAWVHGRPGAWRSWVHGRPGCVAILGMQCQQCGLKRPSSSCSPDVTDCTVKPCTKQLHLTLAHKFYPHHQRTLEQLARAIHPGHGCQWTAALYSRDMRFVHYQVSESGRGNPGLGSPPGLDPPPGTKGCPPGSALTPRSPPLRYFWKRKTVYYFF